MISFNILTIQKYLKEKEKKIHDIKVKTKENSLVEYQKLFNENKIISKETKGNKYIFLRLEGELSQFRKNWLISVDDILEISQYSEISKIGYTNNYIVGISSFKGNVCTIIDMSIFLNNKGSLINSSSCILLRKNEGIALLWPNIEINNIDLGKIDIADYKKESFYENVGFVKDYFIDEEGNIWNELDIDKLLQSKQILDGSNLRKFI